MQRHDARSVDPDPEERRLRNAGAPYDTRVTKPAAAARATAISIWYCRSRRLSHRTWQRRVRPW
jgi:hypothetical protein